MDLIWALSFAFVVGLTIAGFAGSVMEIASGTRLRLAPPFIAQERIVRSLAASLVAGPFMLVNDTLAARAEGRIAWIGAIAGLALAGAWSLATGIVATELAILVAHG